MADLYLIHPFRFGAEKAAGVPGALHNGVAVTADPDRHLRDKILAVLFTAPGERVNRPRFGVGLTRSVFEGLNELTLAALEFRVTEGLRRDVGDEVVVTGVDITAEPAEGVVTISINYFRRTDRVPRNLEIRL